MASSGSQGSSEIDSSPKRTDNATKSILRMSPLRSDLDANKTLRASLLQKDEKRIHFNLENEDETLELQVIFGLRVIFL